MQWAFLGVFVLPFVCSVNLQLLPYILCLSVVITANKAVLGAERAKKEWKLGLWPVVRWPIDPVHHCDNCWHSDGGTCNITRISAAAIQAVDCDWEIVLQVVTCTEC